MSIIAETTVAAVVQLVAVGAGLEAAGLDVSSAAVAVQVCSCWHLLHSPLRQDRFRWANTAVH